jgi:hypothetical protein
MATSIAPTQLVINEVEGTSDLHVLHPVTGSIITTLSFSDVTDSIFSSERGAATADRMFINEVNLDVADWLVTIRKHIQDGYHDQAYPNYSIEMERDGSETSFKLRVDDINDESIEILNISYDFETGVFSAEAQEEYTISYTAFRLQHFLFWCWVTMISERPRVDEALFLAMQKTWYRN